MIQRTFFLALTLLCAPSLAVAQVPSSNHVFLIVEENHSNSSVIGNSAMPYLNSLAQKYGYASNYYANAHSSITDYFALTAGQVVETADWTTSTYSQDNVVRHLLQGGKSWKSYAESLPSIGFTGGDVYPYGQNHNPFAYYTDVVNSSTQTSKLVPFSQFSTDLSNGTLPNYSFIAPNQTHNGHDCSDGTGNCSDSTKLNTADNWLQANIDPLIQSPVFQQDGILVITFDESDSGDNTFGGGHVTTLVIGPKIVSGFQSNNFYQHESVLKMMLAALGVNSSVAGAKLAPDMADVFGGSVFQASVSVSPPTLFLGYPAVGATSGSRTATLTNSESVPLKVNSILASTYYNQSNDCPAQLAPGANCTISVTFTPVTSGIQHGTVAISDDGPGSPQIIYLAGTGNGTGNGTPAPTITDVSPNNGPASGGTKITISGSDFLSGSSVSIGGTKATNVVVNSKTQITATTPAHILGLVDVRVTNSDGQRATLPGGFNYAPTGTTPQATLSPSNLDFGNQQIGTSSSSQTVTLTNSGGGSMSISGISASGDFLESNNCGGSLAAGASCTILLSFTPSQSGTRSATLSVTDSATGSPHTASLTGTGTTTVACSAPSSPGVVVCAPANGATVNSPVNFVAKATPASGQTISAMYVYLDDAVVYKALNTNSLDTNVTVSTGTHVMRTQVWDSSGALYKAGSTITVTTDSTPAAASLTPGSLAFASQTVSTSSAAQSITLTNSGGSPLTVSSIAASGDFAQTNWCGSSLNAGGSCNIAVTFTPTQTGTRTGALTVTDSASGSPHMVSLSGTGISATAAAVTLSPSSLTFTSQQVGSASAAQSITVSNTGGSSLTISSIAASGDFAQTNNCPSSLAAGANCLINVTFSPNQAGTRAGAVSITDSASASPHTASLTGSGTATSSCGAPTGPGVIVCSPLDGSTVTSPVNFLAKATPSSGQSISAMYVYVDDVVVYKALNTNSVNTLVTVATGTHVIRTQVWDSSGALFKDGSTITVSAGNTPATVTLSPSSLIFSSRQIGTISGGQAITLTNSGGAALTLSSIVASGDFAQTDNCPNSLAAGANCSVSVTFSPTQTGTRTGAVSITDSASGSPHTASLTGTGTTTAPLSCSAPSATGVVVCSPQYGATVSSPVNFVAMATPASGETIAAMYVYVDDVIVYKALNTSSVNINVTIASGSHVIRTQVWDTSGALYKAGATIAVN